MTVRTGFLLLLALPPHALPGQGRSEEARRAPRWFVSASGGMQWGNGYVVDGATQTVWDFDGAPQLRGTLERRINDEVSAGVAWSYTRAPLAYRAVSTPTACGIACSADATISTYGVVGRYAGNRGGGRGGFREVVEVFLGATRYGSFQQTDTGTRLPPRGGNVDFAFGAGFGLGYRFGSDWEIVFMQDGISSMHERADVLVGGDRVTRHIATRLGMRMAF